VQNFHTGLNFIPGCSAFITMPDTANVSTDFTFGQLNISESVDGPRPPGTTTPVPHFPAWAILRNTMLTGLEALRASDLSDFAAIKSGYRSPVVQCAINHCLVPPYHFESTSRHMFGEAVDIHVNNNDPAVWARLRDAALAAGGCVEPQAASTDRNGIIHFHVEWVNPCNPRFIH
jgi:hypothetical protein